MGQHLWKPDRPHILVVACSDGRLQEALDLFLHRDLGINEYDRLYLPGGPGALASSGIEAARSEQQRNEFQFLLVAHQVEQVLLVFHGPGDEGPVGAICADYERAFGSIGIQAIRERQAADCREVLAGAFGDHLCEVHVYYCEVGPDTIIRFRSWDVIQN